MKTRIPLFRAAGILGLSTAHSEVVVIGNPGVAALTKDQIADIFLGKLVSFTPLDLPESTAAHSDFYKKATDHEPAQIKAIWSRLIFSGKGQPPRELPNAAAVKKAVAADPKAVGYIDKSDVDSTVKVLLELP